MGSQTDLHSLPAAAAVASCLFQTAASWSCCTVKLTAVEVGMWQLYSTQEVICNLNKCVSVHKHCCCRCVFVCERTQRVCTQCSDSNSSSSSSTRSTGFVPVDLLLLAGKAPTSAYGDDLDPGTPRVNRKEVRCKSCKAEVTLYNKHCDKSVGFELRLPSV